MAQSGTTAPRRGQPTKAQLATDNRRLESEAKEQAAVNGLWKFGVGLVLVLALVVGGIYAIVNWDRESDVVLEPDAVTVPVADVEPDVDNEPLWPEGVKSWTQWESVATEQMHEALFAVTGVTKEQTQKWAAEEQAMGKDFSIEVPPGTAITNSGSNESGWYEVTGYIVKEGDTLFLATDKGIIAVKQSCGNPVRPGGNGQEVKGPNPWPDFIGDHQASVSVPPGTPWYIPGTAEEVTEEQEAAPIGGLDPTPVGTPGTGSGGTTPTGVTEQPDGTVVLVLPPVGEPAPPPPLSEVPAGAVIIEPD